MNDKAKKYKDKEWMYRQSIKKGLTDFQIAEDQGVSTSTIFRWRVHKHGIRKIEQRSKATKANTSRYEDREWLLQKRGDECLTCKEIAKQCKGSVEQVRYYCDKYNISRGETTYREYDWIYTQYIEKELSDPQMGNKLGIPDNVIWYWRVKKHGIESRDFSESVSLARGNSLEITESLLEILDGTLLGDGCLSCKSPHSAFYQFTQQHRSYCEWISTILSEKGIDQCGRINSISSTREEISRRFGNKLPRGNKDKVFTAYHYCSLSYWDLRSEYERWYLLDTSSPSQKYYAEGEKIVPQDVRLTPLSLLIWFLEDGDATFTKTSRHINVRFHTNDYTKEEVDFLISRLKNLLTSNRITRTPKSKERSDEYIIQFGDSSTIESFFDYMAPLPNYLKADYGYKFPSSYSQMKLN